MPGSRLASSSARAGSAYRAVCTRRLRSQATAEGSEVGYRVREQVMNQPAPSEAVARTTQVSGGLQVTVAGSTIRAKGLQFNANLASLVSQDKYANYQVYQRDFFVRSIYLQTD